MTTRPLILPTIHLNGSSAKRLIEQVEEARHTLRQAIEAVQNMDVNDRDYYPQGPDAGPAARDQHRLRQARLLSVQQELTQIYEYLLDHA